MDGDVTPPTRTDPVGQEEHPDEDIRETEGKKAPHWSLRRPTVVVSAPVALAALAVLTTLALLLVS
ncbi:hypothetical protein [Saccharothrix longispora]|uniref:hypothetical protein n=1 Tax=Saccharothrix longispora TaxID=33920 RepID=UPI0028FD5126|nr:hypothetical protein [Saccharothrix longispora]MBY8852120.1 hypothetical protein [Saccharothrix sp. MB29]MDU0288600.1 hypothetical protein [Saccharothrix longispora]